MTNFECSGFWKFHITILLCLTTIRGTGHLGNLRRMISLRLGKKMAIAGTGDILPTYTPNQVQRKQHF